MRRIYRYNEQAKKYLSAIIKKKMPDAQPWLHVGVKTWSQRNPFAAICIWIWDTRQVIWEHRFNNPGVLTNEQMLVQNSRMQLAKDNRQPLVGGRPDVNEWMEFGPEFDASHGSAFDGKDRVTHTALYKRRLAKSMKDGKENTEEALEMLDYDAIRPGMPAETHMGQKVVVIAKAKAKNFARIAKYDESGAMAEEIDDCDPEQGLVAVKWRDNYTAVYVYDNNSITVGNEAAIQVNKEVIVYCWHLVNNTPEEPQRHKVTAIETVSKVLNTPDLRKKLGIVELEGYVEDGLVKTNAFAYLLDNKYWAVNIANNAFERVSIMPV